MRVNWNALLCYYSDFAIRLVTGSRVVTSNRCFCLCPGLSSEQRNRFIKERMSEMAVPIRDGTIAFREAAYHMAKNLLVRVLFPMYDYCRCHSHPSSNCSFCCQISPNIMVGGTGNAGGRRRGDRAHSSANFK